MSPASRAATAASTGALAASGGSACDHHSSRRKDPAMSATKILWGQILVVFLIVLVTTWSATQWTALQRGFQPQLRRPWFRSEENTSDLQSPMRISYAVAYVRKQITNAHIVCNLQPEKKTQLDKEIPQEKQ